jgi:hypothetical protein
MQIFEKFEGDANDRAVIAKYAAQDTLLPLKLMTKLAIFEDITEMANAVKVPVDWIGFRGQQVSLQYFMLAFSLCLCSLQITNNIFFLYAGSSFQLSVWKGTGNGICNS